MGRAPLSEIYLQHVTRNGESDSLDAAVCAYLSDQLSSQQLWDCLNTLQSAEETQDLAGWLQRARDCALIAGLSAEISAPENFRVALASVFKQLKISAYWKEFQLGDALLAVCSEWLRLPYDKVLPKQAPTGLAPLEWGGHWIAAQLPHQGLHAELATWWAVLAQLSGDKSYRSAAVAAADWQLNLLGLDSLPLHGLFTREEEGNPDQLLAELSLLYQLTAKLGERSDFNSHSLAQARALQNAKASVPAVCAFLAQRFAHSAPAEQQASLPSVICDPHATLVGCRHGQLSVAATLCGGNSGLGALHCSTIDVVTYGPQSLPLGDCSQFGVTRPASLSAADASDVSLCAERDHFDLRGRVQVSHSESNFKSSAPLAWLDVRQEFQAGKLNIHSTVYPVHTQAQLAFSFFVDADICHVDESQEIRALSFDRYSGPVRSVSFVSEDQKLSLTALSAKGEMQVIPLSGPPNFWGARFLVAYLLDNKHPQYAWQLAPFAG